MHALNTTAPERRGMTMKQKIKLAAGTVAAIVVGIVVIQNTERVNTQILWANIEMPRILLLLIMLAIGFVLGTLFGHMPRRRRQAGHDKA